MKRQKMKDVVSEFFIISVTCVIIILPFTIGLFLGEIMGHSAAMKKCEAYQKLIGKTKK